MKKIILIIVITCSMNSMAKCNHLYNKYIPEKVIASLLSTTGAPTTGYVGLISSMGGAWAGSLPIMILGSGITTASPMVLGKGITNLGVSISLGSVRDLIDESEVGIGLTLTNITDELNEVLDKVITEDQVAAAVITGNTTEAFCENNSELPFGKLEVFEYLKSELK